VGVTIALAAAVPADCGAVATITQAWLQVRGGTQRDQASLAGI
jgi:hypothetical protein